MKILYEVFCIFLADLISKILNINSIFAIALFDNMAMKRITLIFFMAIFLSYWLKALDWIDEHVVDDFLTIDDKEVPDAHHLPLESDLKAERIEEQRKDSSLDYYKEEPRIEVQRIEITTEDNDFFVDFSQSELQHAIDLENRNLSMHSHAAYNRAIDVAAQEGKHLLFNALIARAGFYLRHRDLDGSERDYRTAVELIDLEKRYALAHYVADAYAKQGLWGESLPWYSRRIAADSKSVSGYTDRAYAYIKLNRYRTALLDYDTALSLAEDKETQERIEFEKAKLYLALGEKEKADASFVKSPQSAAYLRIRTEFYLNQNRSSEAIEAYEKLVVKEPRLAGEYALRAEWLALQGKTDQAHQEFNTAVKLAENDASVIARRAHFFVQHNNFSLALADYTRAVTLDPDSAYRYADRARLLAKMQDYELAIADFSRAIDLEPTRAFRYNERAACYEYQKKMELALNDYAQALRLDPGNITAQKGWSKLQRPN